MLIIYVQSNRFNWIELKMMMNKLMNIFDYHRQQGKKTIEIDTSTDYDDDDDDDDVDNNDQ